MATDNKYTTQYYFKGDFWSGGVILDEYSVIQDEKGNWWKYNGYRQKPFNIVGGETPDEKSWVNLGPLPITGIYEESTFLNGTTLDSRNQFVLDEISGVWYYWNGSLPKIIPENSTVESTGGKGSDAWMAIDGMTSQNINSIIELQKTVTVQTNDVSSVKNMQDRQAEYMLGLKKMQDQQLSTFSGHSDVIKDLVDRVTTTEVNSSSQASQLVDINQRLIDQNTISTSQTEKIDKQTQFIEIINQNLDRFGRDGISQAANNKSQQDDIDKLKEDSQSNSLKLTEQIKNLQDIKEFDEQQKTKFATFQQELDEHSKSTLTQYEALIAAQVRMGNIEATSSSQGNDITDLKGRISAEEKKGTESATQIKGANEQILSIKDRLINEETINKNQDTTLSSHASALTDNAKTLQQHQIDIDNLKKRSDDNDIIVVKNKTDISVITKKIDEQSLAYSAQSITLDVNQKKLEDIEKRLVVAEQKLLTQDNKLSLQENRIISQETKTSGFETRISSQENKMTTQEAKANAIEGRMVSQETKAASQELRMTAVETKNAEQDNRVAKLETSNTAILKVLNLKIL